MRGTRIKTPREKCFVCKLMPDCNHWKYFDGKPVCSKLCAVQGLFIPKPERKQLRERHFEARVPGYQKPARNGLGFWDSL